MHQIEKRFAAASRGLGSLFAVLAVLLLWMASAHAQCAVVANKPVFPKPGGGFFGLTSPQWASIFGSKADANNGTLCNTVLSGSIDLTNALVVFPPISGSTGTSFDLLGNASTIATSASALKLSWGSGLGQVCVTSPQQQCTISIPAGAVTSAMLASGAAASNIGTYAAPTNQFLTGFSGSFSAAQPSFANLSGSATAAQLTTALTAPPPIGATTANTGAFSTLLAGSPASYPIPSIDGQLLGVSGIFNTGTLVNNNAIGVYIKNDLASVGPGSSKNIVLSYGIVNSDVNNAWSWGINPVCFDTAGITGAACNNELDFNINSASTTLYGLLLQGASTVQPTGVYPAIEVAPLDIQNGTSAHIHFSFALESLPAATAGGIFLGATAGTATASLGSQPIFMQFTDSADNIGNVSLSAANYFLRVSPPSIPGTNSGVIASNSVSSTASTAANFLAATLDGQGQFAEIESGSGTAQTSIFNTGTGGVVVTPGTGAFSVAGKFYLGAVTGGSTATKYVCVDASNNVVVQSAAC